MEFSSFFKYCPVCGSAAFVHNNEKSKRCEKCGFQYYMNASAAVAAFVTDSKDRLLVCVRAHEPAKGTWDLPGGFVDNDESAEEACSRELKEELNIDVPKPKYIFSLPNVYQYSGLDIPTLDMFFEIKYDEIQEISVADDVSECFFVERELLDLEKFGLTSIKKAVAMYKAGL